MMASPIDLSHELQVDYAIYLPLAIIYFPQCNADFSSAICRKVAVLCVSIAQGEQIAAQRCEICRPSGLSLVSFF